MEQANKSDRLNLRVEPQLRQLIQTAADLEHKNLSAFILEAARVRAEQRLADQERFSLPPDRFRAFMDALERPPRSIPRLRQLLSEPTVLDRETNVRRTPSSNPEDQPDEV
ncbi:MAG: DUF1778 domain-containing protein [Myxococcota bacterium]